MMVLAWFPGDSVLLLATALLAGGLALGHRAGGLRLALLCSAGLLSAGAAPWLRHAMPDFLLPDHPLSRLMGADFVWAFALAFLFLGLVGQLLHEPLATKLHAHWPADRQEAWQRLNHRLGLVLGGGLSICASWMILTLTCRWAFWPTKFPRRNRSRILSASAGPRGCIATAALGLTPVAVGWTSSGRFLHRRRGCRFGLSKLQHKQPDAHSPIPIAPVGLSRFGG